MTSSSYPIRQMDILWDTLNNRPNANMADHSVGARDELHEVEASQALMFCFAEKFRFVADLVSLFAVPTSRCFSECLEKGLKSSTVHL